VLFVGRSLVANDLASIMTMKQEKFAGFCAEAVIAELGSCATVLGSVSMLTVT